LVDRAGNRSPTKAYAFNAGPPGGVTAPKTGDITAAKTAITTVGAPAMASLTYQWRRGDADAWTGIPAADVTKAVGGGAVTWPLPGQPGCSYRLTDAGTKGRSARQPAPVCRRRNASAT
jgi:hypothetical protein